MNFWLKTATMATFARKCQTGFVAKTFIHLKH